MEIRQISQLVNHADGMLVQAEAAAGQRAGLVL